MARRVLIIGANAAGVEAASAARKKDRTAEITLVTQEKKCWILTLRLTLRDRWANWVFSRFNSLCSSIFPNA
jgi:cation diffusion facilitator CzcD-associated flavoprotein CzcO